MKTIRAHAIYKSKIVTVRATDCGFEKGYVHCWRASVGDLNEMDVLCLLPKDRGVTWVLDNPGERAVLEAINKLVRSVS